MLNSLSMQDLSAQSHALSSGVCTSLELTHTLLKRIHARNPVLNAYLHIDDEGALRDAAKSDARRKHGKLLGPLDGLSLAVKDNIDVLGMPTTAGMATRRARMASKDSFVVRQLRQEGMLVIGKLNMHEAALGATNDNPHFGRCENPLRAGFTPGGSSGGSASAVAAGLCALALGTDTMGSVRIPAAYCGVVGFKASFGKVSTQGSVACCRALDHIGTLTRSQRDLALVMPAFSTYDSDCPDARQVPAFEALQHPRFVAASDIESLGVTIEVACAYRKALKDLRQRGDEVCEISLADYPFGRARRAGLILAEADLLIEHQSDWARHPELFSPDLARFMRHGEQQTGSTLAQALQVFALAKEETARWFEHGDVMLLPTAPQCAFSFDTPAPVNQADLTAIANMAGLPAMSTPLAAARGQLPCGLQSIAPVGCENTLLSLNLDGVCTA